MTHPADIMKKQRECEHPVHKQENRLSINGFAYVVCTECQKIIWMDDVFLQS